MIPQDRKVRSLGCLKTARVVVEHSKCDIPSKYSRFSQFLLSTFRYLTEKRRSFAETPPILRELFLHRIFSYISEVNVCESSALSFFRNRHRKLLLRAHRIYRKVPTKTIFGVSEKLIRHSSSYSGMQIVSCLLLRTCTLQIRTGICSTMK